MVQLNKLFSTAAIGLLSVASNAMASPMLQKRYSNTTSIESSCTPATATKTQLVSVYGPSSTAEPVSSLTAPVIEGEWDNGPIWSIYVPQTYLNSVGIDLYLENEVGVKFTAADFKLLTGDSGNFFYPGNIYTVSAEGLVFDGKTDYPLLKIVVDGTDSYNKDLDVFSAEFSLYVNTIPSTISKRSTLMYDLSLDIEKPGSSSSSSSSSSASSSATGASSSATGASSSATGASSSATGASSSATGASSSATGASSSATGASSSATGASSSATGASSSATGASSSATGASSSATGASSSATGASSSATGASSSATGASSSATGASSSATGASSSATGASSSVTSGSLSTASSSATEASSSATSGASSVSAESSFVPTTSEAVTETVVIGSTITETITSCSDHKCTESVITAVGSVVVTTISDEVTSYTTYCPLTASSDLSAESELTSTIVVGSTTTETVTSCSDHKCTESVITAVGSVVVTTVDDVATTYTTYCPLTAEETSETAAATTEYTVGSVETTVTINESVTLIETSCPVTSGTGEVTIVATVSSNGVESTTSSVVTFTEFSSVTVVTSTVAPTEAATTSASAPVENTTISTVPVEQTSSSSAPVSSDVSVYTGAANKPSSFLSGGLLGAVFGAVMML